MSITFGVSSIFLVIALLAMLVIDQITYRKAKNLALQRKRIKNVLWTGLLIYCLS